MLAGELWKGTQELSYYLCNFPANPPTIISNKKLTCVYLFVYIPKLTPV